MPCIPIANGFLCTFDDGINYKIIVKGKPYHFEFSEMFGPSRTLANGEPSRKDMPLYCYSAISLWLKQGKRVDEKGTCIWDQPPDPLAGAIHLGGRHWYLPGPGEDIEEVKRSLLRRKNGEA